MGNWADFDSGLRLLFGRGFSGMLDSSAPIAPSGTGTAFLVLCKDLRQSAHFLHTEQPVVMRLLFLAAAVNFFASGCLTVGLPFLVRTRLGLSAAWYGAAESVLGLASILGGLLVTVLATHLPFQRMSWLLATFGFSLLPSAVTFAARSSAGVSYVVLIAGMAAASIGCSIFPCWDCVQSSSAHRGTDW